jgi:hypothetical protein
LEVGKAQPSILDAEDHYRDTGKEQREAMNADIMLREMELAAYEMAEAETCERRAHKLRLNATKRIASVHLEMQIAVSEFKNRIDNTKSRINNLQII